MCGILGVWHASLPNSYESHIASAIRHLKNRGPNAQDYKLITGPKSSSLILAHTRLAIIDLTSNANQPMSSFDERYTITFNGEIYNYQKIKHELKLLGHHFKSQSDTEVLLKAWQEWGTSCLNKFIGMFAFAIYDREECTLTCVRDAFGIKPFFYLYNACEFLFASELPALLALYNKKPEIDLQRSYDYLVHGLYDCQERSFVKGVNHLLPGHMMCLDLKSNQLNPPVAWYHPTISERHDLNFAQATEKEAQVKVILDGQGADELLAGYHGYPGQRLLSYLEQGKIAHSLRFAKNWSLWPGRHYSKAWMDLGRIVLPDSLYAQAGKWIGRSNKPVWLNSNYLRERGVTLNETRVAATSFGKGRRVVEKMASSLKGKGLAQLLRHGDRDSMRFSIENRVPFLTQPFANLLLSLPEHYLISDYGQTKHIFRAAMRGIVPNDILDRRDKIGFSTPEKNWMLSMIPTLRTWLQGSQQIPILNSQALLAHFDALVSGKSPFNWQVWRWINYIKWYEKTIGGEQ